MKLNRGKTLIKVSHLRYGDGGVSIKMTVCHGRWFCGHFNLWHLS